MKCLAARVKKINLSSKKISTHAISDSFSSLLDRHRRDGFNVKSWPLFKTMKPWRRGSVVTECAVNSGDPRFKSRNEEKRRNDLLLVYNWISE